MKFEIPLTRDSDNSYPGAAMVEVYGDEVEIVLDNRTIKVSRAELLYALAYVEPRP